MENKRNAKHEKRVKKLAVACALCAVIISVSTYAWFIGMKTVNVSGFDVEIAATEGLYLSLNGEDWDYTVKINEENVTTAGYDGNTNSWGGEGLIPMSTVGKINTVSSRLTMYEKGSFTASPGGYRIMASEVENTGLTEANGYVAFDLFIKNLSGNEYYTNLDLKNEEAIYLTPESKVIVSDAGADADKTGIENSVRVAFAQIGRVIATTGANAEADDYEAQIAKITGISCAGGGIVTSICTRDAQIWEPNDTAHVDNAINWYSTACKMRTGADITKPGSFGAACNPIVNGTPYPTYAVSGVIDETDQVDNYDGEAYNGWPNSISTTAAKGKLVAVDTFTDSEKNEKGVDRPEFMRLAPNSITKVRVYIYLEGQDVDNYDFASLGKQISVNFGFTKERFDGEDVGHTGPELPDDVQSVREADYTATGAVTNIVPNTVTFGANVFNVPRDVLEFTFEDGGTAKKATYQTPTVAEPDGKWTIENVVEGP